MTVRKIIIAVQYIPLVAPSMNRNIIQDYNDLGIEFVFQKPVNLRSFKQAVEKSLRKSITGNKKITSLDKQTT